MANAFDDLVTQSTAAPPDPETSTFSDVMSYGGETLRNVPGSAVRFLEDLVRPITEPVETAENLWRLGSGVVQLLMPGEQSNEGVARAVGQFLAERYGGMDEALNTIKTDPVGFLADASTVLTGGAGLAARAPGAAGRVARTVGRAGANLDPVSMATRGASAATNAMPYAAAAFSGVGTTPVREALRAGREGGEAAARFVSNMRGRIPGEQVVAEASELLDQMRRDRGARYVEDMQALGKNTEVLDFRDIDRAVGNTVSVGRFKGVDIDPPATEFWNQIEDAVGQWRELPPDMYHTPVGLDALKQRIGKMRSRTQFGTPERMIADNVYNAIKNVIIEKAPVYGKIMRDYERTSAQLDELRRTLSLGETNTIDTALRKLQSLMRNNVNTTYGRRLALVDEMDPSGATIRPAVAGQALNAPLPRGVQGAVTPAMSAGASIATGNPLPLLALPLTSPRVMGEMAYRGGQLERFAPELARSAGTSSLLFQTGRAADEADQERNRLRLFNPVR